MWLQLSLKHCDALTGLQLAVCKRVIWSNVLLYTIPVARRIPSCNPVGCEVTGGSQNRHVSLGINHERLRPRMLGWQFYVALLDAARSAESCTLLSGKLLSPTLAPGPQHTRASPSPQIAFDTETRTQFAVRASHETKQYGP